MKLWTARNPRTPHHAAPPPCDPCEADLAHCHETLVVHADGATECEGFPDCGADPAAHDLWMACSELEACGCTGDDHDLGHDLPLAA